MLPKNTILGELTIIEIYEFYNMPVLFTCRNRTGHLYAAVWIDETRQENVWLYTPLSPQRLMHLRSGEVDLHEVFAQPEDGFVFKVSVPKSTSDPAQINPIPQAQILESWLPVPDDYVDLAMLPPIVWENVDQRIEKQENANPPLVITSVPLPA